MVVYSLVFFNEANRLYGLDDDDCLLRGWSSTTVVMLWTEQDFCQLKMTLLE